nr:MAG TPA: hypothetical protein [Caudoviricetes sp.]
MSWQETFQKKMKAAGMESDIIRTNAKTAADVAPATYKADHSLLVEQQKNDNQSVFSRAGKTVTGGLKGSLAGNMDAMGVAYQAGQGGRTQRNTAALKDAQWAVARAKYAYDTDKTPASAAELDNALKQMKAYATVLGDGAYDQALKAAYDASGQMGTADLNKLYGSLGKVNVNPTTGVQQKATKASRDLALQVQQSASRDIESAKTGLGTFGQMLVDAGASMAQMGGDIAANALMGTSGSMLPFATRAFGGGTMQARESGADFGQQVAYGAVQAGKEVLTEKMFNMALPFAKAYGGGALDDVTQRAIQTAVDKLGKTAAGKRALNAALQLTASGVGEGLEELIGDWMEWQMPRIYGGDVDTAGETLANSLYDFVVGGMAGVAGSVISPGTYQYGNEAAVVQENTAPEMDSKAAQAVDAVTRGESITGNQAAAIAKNPVAVETLETNTGVKLNTQQPISQLKRDIAALASRDTTQAQSQGTTAAPVTQRRAQKPTGGFLEAGQKAYQEMSRTAEDVPALYAGFSSVYNAGLNGIEASKAKGAYAAMLTPEQRYAAYNAGLEDAAVQVARENAEVKSVTTTAGAGLADNVYSRAVIAKSKRTAATLNAMGKKLGVRIEFVDSVMGGQANGQYIRDKNLIQVAVDSNKPYLNVAAHEVTHRMQDLSPAEYRKFRQAAMEHRMREKGSDEMAEVVEWYREKAESSGVTLTQDEVMDEIAADFAGDMMENPDLFREFSQSNRTAAQKLLDSLKELIAKVKSIFTGKARDNAAMDAYGKTFGELEDIAQKWQAAFDAAERQAERATVSATVRSGDTVQYDDAVYSLRVTDKDTLDFLDIKESGRVKTAAGEGDGAKYQIKQFPNGMKYVQADRQVLFGNDPVAWSEQLENYINGKIRNNEDVRLIAEDGDILILTRTSAGKLSSRYNNYGQTMSDETFERKANAASHIDELIKVSVRGGETVLDEAGRHGDMAKDGWNYRTAYFMDFDGKYYRTRISVALGKDGSIVYNIGKMQERSTPRIAGSSGNSGALLGNASVNSIPTDGENVKPKFSLKAYSEAEKKDHVKSAKEFFGKTYNWNETGYITTDGTKLDFSGRHDGGPGGYRAVDHRDIRDALGLDYGGDDYSGAMVQFMGEGNIRISPESGGINLSVMPTKAQLDTLADFISKNRGEVVLDLDDTNGNTVSSTEYPRGTHSSKVINDIKAYFETGTMPQVSELGKFRYQLRETQRLPDELEDLRDTYIRRYGEIPEGENATRQVRLPRKTSDKKKVSQTVRTILEANATPDEIVPTIEELALRGEYSYETYSDKQAISDAETKIKDVGWAQALTSWTDNVRRGNVSKENTAMGWALYNNAANSGDTATALTILNNMVEHQRSAAQALQATRILKKLSPETQLYQVQRSVKNLQEEINKRYGDKKSPKLKIDRELAERFLRAKDQKERDNVLTDIYRDIGRQMPSRFIDKWNAWRYLAMLGNARTHIRNIVGNAGFAPVVAVKNAIATGVEAGVNKVSGGKLNRSKAFVSGKGGKALFSAAAADFDKIQDVAMGGGKYSEFANANKAIEEGRVIFRSKIPGLKQVSEGLEKARRFNSAALETEDMWFSKPHYAYAMAQYCKANGITAEMIAEGKGIEKARKYAIKEAQKATYRDTNAFSQFVSEIGRRRGSKTGVEKIATGIIEGILPFRKTPANILMRGVEYSPLGLANGIKQALWDVRTGKKTGAEAIDSISAGLTGTGLLGLGVYLASQALLRGHGGDDDDKREFEDLQGHQTYSLELPDGTSITLDWLAPECLPLFIGVNLWEETNGGKESLTLSELLTAISNVSEPLLEMSCLQSLNAIFDVVGYAKSDGIAALPKAIASAATSYLTQAFPTLLGQAERTGEGKRYTTYTNKNNKYLTPDMQYAVGKASARIPGWDYNQIPYIDAWGRTELTGKPGERAFNNFLNPAYTSKIDESPMEKELMRLYNATGESVFPSRASKNLTVNGEAVTLGADDYVKYAQQKGQGAYKRLTALTRDSEYKKLTNEEKVQCVKDLYTLTDQIAKSKVSKYEPESWVTKAIAGEKKGISATDYVIARAKTSDVESLKDKNGETIANSKGLLVMEQIYSIGGLTSDQRQYLFSAMGVGKKIIHYNKALVQQELRKMRNQ